MVAFAEEPEKGLPIEVSWIHGSESSKHNTDPDIQVYAYDEHTYIMRQNKAVHYEAPFMFLLFGNNKAVLIDTGATESAEHFPLRKVVDGLIDGWLADHPQDNYGLIVIHSHSHADHIAGDAQFADRPDTAVAPTDLAGMREFLGLTDDPLHLPFVYLGGRWLWCMSSPGHHKTAVMYHDSHTGILFTGDTFYPGRLYVEDWAAYEQTLTRLVAYHRVRPVTHLIGCHIEMTTTPGVDYPVRTTYQPDEPPLELTAAQLERLWAEIHGAEIPEVSGQLTMDDFILVYEKD